MRLTVSIPCLVLTATVCLCGCVGPPRSEKLPGVFLYVPTDHLESSDVQSQDEIAFVGDKIRSGQTDEAIQQLTKKIATADNNAAKSELYLLRGVCRYSEKDAAGAIEDYSTAVELNPDDWRPLFHRWQAYLFLGDESNASKDREAGRRLNPDLFDADYSPFGGVI